MQQEISLQNQLIKKSMLSSVIAGLIALILLIVVATYHTMTVNDEIMDEISDMLLISDLSQNSGQQLDEISDEFDIQYILKDQKQILTHSEHYSQPDQYQHIWQTDRRYSFIWTDQQVWRRYVYTDHDMQMTAEVYQPLSIRFKELLNSFLGYAVILLFLWFVQWWILHFMIKKQFRPIRLLSKKIAEKSAHDLTPIQQQQPELKELQPMVSQLNQLLTRLEQSLIAEQRFTADASHELRSPLSAIQMRLQVMNRKYQNQPHLAQDLAQIQLDVSRGALVLDNLLLLARLDPTDLFQLPRCEFDIAELIQEVVQALKPLAENKNITIKENLTSIWMTANRELIFTCLRNVVDNAIRYVQLQGHVHIHLLNQNNGVQIIIEDDGQGVNEEVLARLGERFYRALGTKTQGSGLGISICKKIIELHQGKISFSQSNFAGLKVEIDLPKNQ